MSFKILRRNKTPPPPPPVTEAASPAPVAFEEEEEPAVSKEAQEALDAQEFEEEVSRLVQLSQNRAQHVRSAFAEVLQSVREARVLTVAAYADFIRKLAPLPHAERRALRDALYEADPERAKRHQLPPPESRRRVTTESIIEVVSDNRLPKSADSAVLQKQALMGELFSLGARQKDLLWLGAFANPEEKRELEDVTRKLKKVQQTRKDLETLRCAFRVMPKTRFLGDSGINIEVFQGVTAGLAAADAGMGMDVSAKNPVTQKRTKEPYGLGVAGALGTAKLAVVGRHRRGYPYVIGIGPIAVMKNHPFRGDMLIGGGNPFLQVAATERGDFGLTFLGIPGFLPHVPYPIDCAGFSVFINDPRLAPTAEKTIIKLQKQIAKSGKLKDKVKAKLGLGKKKKKKEAVA